MPVMSFIFIRYACLSIVFTFLLTSLSGQEKGTGKNEVLPKVTKGNDKKKPAVAANAGTQPNKDAPHLPSASTPAAPGGTSSLEVSLQLANRLRADAENRIRDHSSAASEVNALASRPLPFDPTDSLKALSIGMIRLREGLQSQAGTLQKSLGQKSAVRVLLTQDEISTLQDAANGLAGVVVDLGSSRDRFANAPKSSADWPVVKTALQTAAQTAEKDRAGWVNIASTADAALRAEKDRLAREAAAQQQVAQQIGPQGRAAKADPMSGLVGTWSLVPGQSGPPSMEIDNERWTIRTNSGVCNVTRNLRMNVPSEDGKNVDTLLGGTTERGLTIRARFNPDQSGNGFMIYVETPLDEHCMNATGLHYERARARIQGQHELNPQASVGTRLRPKCHGLFRSVWESKDGRETFLFEEINDPREFNIVFEVVTPRSSVKASHFYSGFCDSDTQAHVKLGNSKVSVIEISGDSIKAFTYLNPDKPTRFQRRK